MRFNSLRKRSTENGVSKAMESISRIPFTTHILLCPQPQKFTIRMFKLFKGRLILRIVDGFITNSINLLYKLKEKEQN